MPVKIPDGLPAAQILTEENIFVMSNLRAAAQDIRPLRIAVVNLMPTKLATETQLLRMLGNTPLQVEVTLLHTSTYESKNTDRNHLASFYRTFDEVREESFDGLVITGAPVEKMDYESVAYWSELSRVMDWADSNVFSTFYICWAAQAALYYYYKIPKHELMEKLFGIYPHRLLTPHHKLVRGFDDAFYAPHSRHTTVGLEAVMACPDLDVLAISDEAGLYLAASKDGTRVFVMGHSEYDPLTLDGEYRRDLDEGKAIRPPVNYYPGDDAAKPPRVTWRSHANLLYSNWLNYFVYQETPFDRSKIRKKSEA